MAVVWTTKPEAAFVALAEAYIEAIWRNIYALARRYAVEIENWMKANAKWTDRSGNARQTLSAEAFQLSNQAVDIILAHGMDYGIFLELAHAGKWAIIAPALDYFAPRIWQDVLRLLRA